MKMPYIDLFIVHSASTTKTSLTGKNILQMLQDALQSFSEIDPTFETAVCPISLMFSLLKSYVSKLVTNENTKLSRKTPSRTLPCGDYFNMVLVEWILLGGGIILKLRGPY